MSVSAQIWATAIGIAFLGNFIYILHYFMKFILIFISNVELKLSTLRDAWEMATQKSVSFIGIHAGSTLPVAKAAIRQHSK